LLEQKKYSEAFAAFQLAKHYGSEDANLLKKIDFSRKQIRNSANNSTDSLVISPNLKLIIISSIVVVIFSFLFLYFVEFEQIMDKICWLFNLYFGDLW